MSPPLPNEPTDDPLARLRVVLVRTSHPGNIGGVARAMHTMGLADLVLVAPRRFPDPEATAMAAGADALLERVRVVATLAEALAGSSFSLGLSARRRELAHEVLPIREAMGHALTHARHASVALVLGTEMSGLSNEELAHCAMVATIPANPAFSSLNLAAAAQIACYEARVLATGGGVWASPRFAPASFEDTDALYAHAARTLARIGFLDPARPRRLLPRLRRLFARRGLEHEEVNILRGILTAVDERLDGTRR